MKRRNWIGRVAEEQRVTFAAINSGSPTHGLCSLASVLCLIASSCSNSDSSVGSDAGNDGVPVTTSLQPSAGNAPDAEPLTGSEVPSNNDDPSTRDASARTESNTSSLADSGVTDDADGGLPSLVVTAGDARADSVVADSGALTCQDEIVTTHLQSGQMLIAVSRSVTMTQFGQDVRKWIPTTRALASFTDDQGTLGLRATLSWWPFVGSNAETRCDPIRYTEPVVPTTALPNQNPFVDAILQVSTSGGGGLNVALLQGLYGQAASLGAAQPDTETSVVLIADLAGESCGEDQSAWPDELKQAAESAPDNVTTHVIGLGEGSRLSGPLDLLSEVAMSGGSQALLLADLSDSDETRTRIFDELHAIRRQLTRCTAVIPELPREPTFEPAAPRVQIVAAPGQVTDLEFDPDCETGSGWHYEDPSASTAVLCEASCEAAKDRNSELQFLFTCSAAAAP